MRLEPPCGLVLAGGGTLGAWQLGALERLSREVEFRHVLGISAGALNGAAYQAGRLAEAGELWRTLEALRPLRLSPRLRPPTLFSAGPLREAVSGLVREEELRRSGRCRLTVVSLCLEDRLPMMAEFIPDPMIGAAAAPACGMAAAGARAGWDAPLLEHLMASCAIPFVFPPVRLGEATLVDGGVPGRAPLNLEILSACRSVVVLEMGRPDEPRPPAWRPAKRLDWLARRLMRRMMDEGTDSLKHVEKPPAVHRLCPSRRLDYVMLSFKARHCVPAIELGMRDAERLLKSLEALKA